VVNTSSEGGVGRMVSIGINGNINSFGIRQATKSIIGNNKRNNTFFRISQEHDHSAIGGASNVAAVESRRRTEENGGRVLISDEAQRVGKASG